jgi:glycosyltransferase involved in cell wall biosynthesis
MTSASPQTSIPSNDALISIVVPFLNAARFLEDTIASVRHQTHDHWELVLVDDGSTDRSTDVARQSAACLPDRIRVLTHEGGRHAGVGASRNLGMRHARGAYVCFLDADDLLVPHALETSLALLTANPEAGAVCGAFQCWYSWDLTPGRPRDFTVLLGVPSERLYQPPELLLYNLRTGGRKPGIGAVLLKRACFALEPCDERFVGIGEDQVFWARLALSLPIFVTDVCLLQYRQHADSLCALALKNGKDLAGWHQFLRWLAQSLTVEGDHDPAVSIAIDRCQKGIVWQHRLFRAKRLGRQVLSLRTRYRLRNCWITLQSLRSRHRLSRRPYRNRMFRLSRHQPHD